MTTYSICVCNYNMADTIEMALTSVLDQVDDRFEMVVVDDGSTDNSVVVLKELQRRYASLRLITLRRDPRRKLGLTRNISIREARGTYVLPQIDCDDVYGPHILDFVNVFHQIEHCHGGSFYLKGDKINMAPRDFLLAYGPYRNLFRSEDRDMWIRLAADDTFLPIIHRPFHTRLPKTRRQSIQRALVHGYDQMTYDFRSGTRIASFVEAQFSRRLDQKNLLRWALALPAWAAAKRAGPLHYPPAAPQGEAFAAYRARTQGTFSEIMRRFGGEPDYSQFHEDARKLFDLGHGTQDTNS